MEAIRRLSTPHPVRARSVSGPYQVRIYNYGEDTEKALPYTKTLQVSVSAGIKIVSLPDKSSRSVCRLRFGV